MLRKVASKLAYAFDVTYIDNVTVATTSNILANKCVSIIDIDTEKVIKFIPTNSQCYGIKHYNGALFVCATSEGILKLNPQDGVSTVIVQSALLSHSYIKILNNRIYYTNHETKTVNCCDMNGKAIWTFKDKTHWKMRVV